MGHTTFYIVLNLRTSTGYEPFGKFFLGNNRKQATAVFNKLKGVPNVDEQTVLQLDLMETINELPVNMQVISCSLDDLAENCRIITRETFRRFNMGEL